MSHIPFQSTKGFKGFLSLGDGLQKDAQGVMKLDTSSGLGYDQNGKLENQWYDVSANSNVDMNSNRITNVANPTASGDVANKSYIDSNLATTLGDKLHPFGIPDDIISTHFDGEIAENVDASNGWVTKIWDATGKGFDYTATEAMKYTYNSTEKRIEMTATSGQRMIAPLPSGASNNTQPFSWTMVTEIAGDFSGNHAMTNLFNGGGSDSVRNNIYYSGGGNQLVFFVNALISSDSNFWNHDRYYYRAPKKLIITVNYNTSANAFDVYINNRWFGRDAQDRNKDEMTIGNDDDGHDLPLNGYLYESFYTHDSLTESQIGNIHNFLNDKWDVFVKPTVDIFTMAGQSNMVGKGDSSKSPNPDYGFLLDPQYWNSSRTQMTTIKDPVSGNLGTANTGCAIPAFCQEYYNETGRIPVILHVAKSGTSIFEDTEWNPDASQSNYTDDTINILSDAENELTTLGWSIGKKSVLWHQGEQDNSETVQDYKDKFLALVDKILNNGYEYFFYYEISTTNGGDDYTSVQEAQRLAHQERDNLYMIFSCSNFIPQGETTDGTHYTQTAYNLMGRKGAKSIASNVINNQQNKWYLNKARTDVDMNENRLTNISAVTGSDAIHKGYVDTMTSQDQLLRACRGYWALDGNYTDSINGYDGTEQGGGSLSFSNTAMIGQSLEFSGVDGDYVTLGGSAFDFGTSDFTWQCWVRLTNFNNNITFLQTKGSNFMFLGANQSLNKFECGVNDGSTTKLQFNTSIQLYQWYHLLLTRTGGTNYTLYLNGVNDGSGTLPSGNFTGSASFIGHDTVNNGSEYIDEVSAWNRALSESEINYLYNEGKGTQQFSLYDFYNCPVQSNFDMNNYNIVNAEQVLMREVSIDDDSVHSIPVSQTMGKIMVSFNQDMMDALFDLSTPDYHQVGSLGSLIKLNVGSASGTEGTDGDLHVFVDSSNSEIDLENRTGSTVTVRYCVYA